MGHMPRLASGAIDRAAMRAEAAARLASAGLSIDLDARLGALRTSEQQLVEIARALSLRARVLIMGEPAAALSQRGVTRLFQAVAELEQRGVAMMFVGHRMDEIFKIADRMRAAWHDGVCAGHAGRSGAGAESCAGAASAPRRRHYSGALGRSGLPAPDHIALAGFDDFERAGYLQPRLTDIAQPRQIIGREAASLLEQARLQRVVFQAFQGFRACRPASDYGLQPAARGPETRAAGGVGLATRWRRKN